MARKTRRREFSKIILVCVSAAALGVTVYACVLMWHTSDTSPLAYLVPSIFAELATATGFYYRKAQAENEIKIAQNTPPDNPPSGA